jgi:hypothetical protein
LQLKGKLAFWVRRVTLKIWLALGFVRFCLQVALGLNNLHLASKILALWFLIGSGRCLKLQAEPQVSKPVAKGFQLGVTDNTW